MNPIVTGFLIILSVLAMCCFAYLNITGRDGDAMGVLGVMSLLLSKPWRWMP